MRHGGNFHPEWGYLAPAPGFMRAARVAAVAAAVGATAGAAVAFSLGGNSGPAEISVATRTLVAAPADTVPRPQQVEPSPVQSAANEEREMPPREAAPASRVADVAAAEKHKDLIADRSASSAATEQASVAPAVAESDRENTTASERTAAEKKVAKRRARRSPSRAEQSYAQYGSGRGPLEIMPSRSYLPPSHSYALRAPYPYDGYYPPRAYPPRAYSWGEYIWGAD